MSVSNSNNMLSDQAIKDTRHKFYDEVLFKEYKTSYKNMKRSRITFTLEDPKKVVSTVACPILKGAATGAFIGGTAGGIVGGCVGGPPGILPGIGIGGGIGAAVGGIAGFAVGVTRLENEYDKWSKTEKGRDFSAEIQIFLNAIPELKGKFCGITRRPVIEAVRTPSGQIYERKEIVKYIKENGKDPITKEILSEKHLIEDDEFTYKVCINLRKILRQDIPYFEEKDKELLNGFIALNHDVNQKMNQLHAKEKEKIEQKREKNEITYMQYMRLTDALSEKYPR